MSSEKVRRAVEIGVVFAAYVATARLGLWRLEGAALERDGVCH